MLPVGFLLIEVPKIAYGTYHTRLQVAWSQLSYFFARFPHLQYWGFSSITRYMQNIRLAPKAFFSSKSSSGVNWPNFYSKVCRSPEYLVAGRIGLLAMSSSEVIQFESLPNSLVVSCTKKSHPSMYKVMRKRSKQKLNVKTEMEY